MATHCSDPGVLPTHAQDQPPGFQAHLVHIFLVCSEITPHCWKKNTAEMQGQETFSKH